MATTPLINPGEISSASKLNNNFETLRALGTSVLNSLSAIKATTLVDYDRRLSALRLRQARAQKLLPRGVIAQFNLADWEQINQTDTTATIRVDTGSATLREKKLPGTVLVANTAFSTSIGSVSSLDQNQTLFRVTSDVVPTVTFDLTLTETVDLGLLSFDLSALSSSPDLSVSVSADGAVFTPAHSVQLVGSSLTAWFTPQPAKYVKLVITPASADSFGGNFYTFGIKEVTGTSIKYALTSDIYFKPIDVYPTTAAWVLRANQNEGCEYYLRLTATDDNGNVTTSGFVSYKDGDTILLPGASYFNATGVAINAGTLVYESPVGTYSESVVLSASNGLKIPVLSELFGRTDDPINQSFHNLYSICNISFSTILNIFGVGTYTLLPTSKIPAGATYNISGQAGPFDVVIEVYVRLSTTDRNKTPVFTGLSIEEK